MTFCINHNLSDAITGPDAASFSSASAPEESWGAAREHSWIDKAPGGMLQ